MATTTLTEEVPVEVTTSAANGQNEPKESTSRFAKLRRRLSNNKSNTKRPPDAKWRQQQIPACRPVFSAKHVFVGFTVIGLVFLALGILFTVVLMRLREMSVDYTECIPTTPEILSASFNTCDQYVKCKRDCDLSEDTTCRQFLYRNESEINATYCRALPLCECQVNITLSQPLRQIVHVYYGINNFYQNHRRYLRSIDLQQLHGDFLRIPSSDCLPLITENGTNLPYLPCGLIGNSWFNDSIVNIQEVGGPVYDINRHNVAWETDRNTRFNGTANPPEIPPHEVASPPNWPEGGILAVPDGLNNESLIVWFRVSAFPWFRKLYGRLMLNGNFTDMPASRYVVNIIYSYPVTDFDGTKSVILAEVSWLGGRNLFLGIAYIVVGVFLLIAAVVLLIIHLRFSKWKTTDKNFLNRSY